MQYYEGLKFSEFKESMNKLFQDLINKIVTLKAASKAYFAVENIGDFKLINDKSAKYIGEYTYSPSHSQRNLKINFFQLHEIYKTDFLKKGVLFEDFCKIILLHEVGHAIDFNSYSRQERPLSSLTNELAGMLKKIDARKQDVICEVNRVILQINQYVKENIYIKEKKANEIAGMLIKKLEKNNHSLKRAFKIFLAHHKQYLEFEDIPIIREVMAKKNIASQVQQIMKEYLEKRTNEKFNKVLNRIRKEQRYNIKNYAITPLLRK